MQNIEITTTEETFEPVNLELTESLQLTPPSPETVNSNEVSGADFLGLLGAVAIITTIAGASINFSRSKKS